MKLKPIISLMAVAILLATGCATQGGGRRIGRIERRLEWLQWGLERRRQQHARWRFGRHIGWLARRRFRWHIGRLALGRTGWHQRHAIFARHNLWWWWLG